MKFIKDINSYLLRGKDINHSNIGWFWIFSASITLLCVYFYVFMEWLFFATKPSFMSILSFDKRLEILFELGLLLAVFSIFINFLLIVLVKFIIPSKYKLTVLIRAVAILPTMIMVSLILLLLDNFTYTIFNFGIVSSEGLIKVAYIFLIVGVAIIIFKRVSTFIKESGDINFIWRGLIFLTSLALTLTSIIYLNTGSDTFTLSPQAKLIAEMPNIILLGSDGLNAENMSVYGYERDTTPYIKEFAQDALVAENAFTNSGNSGGEIASMLTGKLPTETRMIYPPNILRGIDSFQHLPGILKNIGYKTYQLSCIHYGDAYKMNMQNAFDMANLRSEKDQSIFPFLTGLSEEDTNFFFHEISERLLDRLLHILFIEEMRNPFDEVTNPGIGLRDERQIDLLLSLIHDSTSPFFIHVHLTGTHGAYFKPSNPKYSEGKEQTQPWMTDFYDDAILNYDKQVKNIVESLQDSGTLDNTIIVLNTDHASQWRTNIRIPLIMRFPFGEYDGMLPNNVQNLDIAPTLLDYLDLPQPEWMDGTSLLNGNPPQHREIFSASTDGELVSQLENGLWTLNQDATKPPFYELGNLGLVICNRWFNIKFVDIQFQTGIIQGHTAPCEESTFLQQEEAIEKMKNHLADNGYDIAQLQYLHAND